MMLQAAASSWFRAGAVRVFALTCAVLLLACQRSPESPSLDGASVLSGRPVAYDFHIDLASGVARSIVHVAVAEPGSCYSLPSVHPVLDVRWNGEQPARSTWRDGVLEVCGAAPAGSSLTIEGAVTIPEETSGEVGLRRRPLGTGVYTSLLSWIEGCARLGPCDPAPDVLVDVRVEVTHAAGEVVLCPGRRSASATTTRCEVTAAPTYSAFTIAAYSGWIRAPFAEVDGLRIDFYEPPTSRLAISIAPADVAAFVRWMVQLFGAFPYGDELRVAGAPMQWLGFEPPANILLRHDLSNTPSTDYANPALHALLHEIAHQWAGNRTTLRHRLDIVWKEAIAEYLTYVYEDEHRPIAEAMATRRLWNRIGTPASYYPLPKDDPPPVFETFTADVYGTGPAILFLQLEGLLGRAAVMDAIRRFLAQPGPRSLSSLRGDLEAATRLDLGPYFAAWVEGQGDPERPRFQIRTDRQGAELTVVATQEPVPSGQILPCVVEVELQGPTASALVPVRYGLAPTDREARATITFLEDPVTVSIDPQRRLLRWR